MAERDFTFRDEDASIGDLLDPKIVESILLACPEFTVIETAAGVAAFRCMKLVEYQRYQSFIFDEAKRARASEFIARTTCVYPEPKEFERMLEARPGIISTIANAVLEYSGQVNEPRRKKYGKSSA